MYPTDRRGRYLRRRAKQMRQARRASKNRRCTSGYWHVEGQPWYHGPPYTMTGDGRFITGPMIVGHPLDWPVPIAPFVIDGAYEIFRQGKYGQWVVKLADWVYEPLNPNQHFPIALVGFHRRRVRYRGRKVDRLDGPSRLRSLLTMKIAADGEGFVDDPWWEENVTPWH